MGEAFYVLSGEYHIFIRDEEFAYPAGSFICIPAGEQHGFRVGGEPSRKLNIYAPARAIGYFDELSEPASVPASWATFWVVIVSAVDPLPNQPTSADVIDREVASSRNVPS